MTESEYEEYLKRLVKEGTLVDYERTEDGYTVVLNQPVEFIKLTLKVSDEEEDEPEDCPDCHGTNIGNPHDIYSSCPTCRGKPLRRDNDE